MAAPAGLLSIIFGVHGSHPVATKVLPRGTREGSSVDHLVPSRGRSCRTWWCSLPSCFAPHIWRIPVPYRCHSWVIETDCADVGHRFGALSSAGFVIVHIQNTDAILSY